MVWVNSTTDHCHSVARQSGCPTNSTGRAALVLSGSSLPSEFQRSPVGTERRLRERPGSGAGEIAWDDSRWTNGRRHECSDGSLVLRPIPGDGHPAQSGRVQTDQDRARSGLKDGSDGHQYLERTEQPLQRREPHPTPSERSIPLRKRKRQIFGTAIQTGHAPESLGRGNAGASTCSKRRCCALRSRENDNKWLDRTVHRGACHHRIVQRTHIARSHRAQLTDRAMSAAASMRSGVDSEQPRDSIPSENNRPGRNAPDLYFGTDFGAP